MKLCIFINKFSSAEHTIAITKILLICFGKKHFDRVEKLPAIFIFSCFLQAFYFIVQQLEHKKKYFTINVILIVNF